MDIEVAEERNDEVLVLSPVGRLDSGNVCSFESVVMDHVSLSSWTTLVCRHGPR